MAADPMGLGDSSASRTGTGLGIALAIGVTIGAVALLWPRLREEMRGDIFSSPPSTAMARPPAASPVPAASLAPGESVVVAPTAAAAPAGMDAAASSHRAVVDKPAKPPQAASRKGEAPRAHAAAGKSHRVKSRPADRSRPPTDTRVTASPPRPEIREVRAASEPPLRTYREREPLPPRRREWREPRRESPWDIRTWREHHNPDVPSTSPVDRQPG